MVEVLRNNPEGRGFDFRLCHCYFSLTQSFRPHHGTGVYSAFGRNDYQGYILRGGIKAAGVCGCQPYQLHVLLFWKSWEPQTSWDLRACPVLYRACPVLYRACPVLYRDWWILTGTRTWIAFNYIYFNIIITEWNIQNIFLNFPARFKLFSFQREIYNRSFYLQFD